MSSRVLWLKGDAGDKETIPPKVLSHTETISVLKSDGEEKEETKNKNELLIIEDDEEDEDDYDNDSIEKADPVEDDLTKNIVLAALVNEGENYLKEELSLHVPVQIPENVLIFENDLHKQLFKVYERIFFIA